MAKPESTTKRTDTGTEADEWDAPLTEQALEAILTSPSIDVVAAADSPENDVVRNLPGYLSHLMNGEGIDASALSNATGVGYQQLYDVLNRGKGLGRDRALAVCFGLHCSLRQAQRLLWHAGASRLYARNRRDAIIIYCLEHRMPLAQTEQALYEFGEKTLGEAK